ncbi:hypothetical protein K440DRAFT_295697 [Wilcoxina mikolae CBS 423.85]|nr:hypothetical protein K440DRAFT_295697 [Wilcoxina mikolae CBS 423.85]
MIACGVWYFRAVNFRYRYSTTLARALFGLSMAGFESSLCLSLFLLLSYLDMPLSLSSAYIRTRTRKEVEQQQGGSRYPKTKLKPKPFNSTPGICFVYRLVKRSHPALVSLYL